MQSYSIVINIIASVRSGRWEGGRLLRSILFSNLMCLIAFGFLSIGHCCGRNLYNFAFWCIVSTVVVSRLLCLRKKKQAANFSSPDGFFLLAG